ncbi:MAG: M23 family metallopeptidase [Halanaerobiales bacterium]
MSKGKLRLTLILLSFLFFLNTMANTAELPYLAINKEEIEQGRLLIIKTEKNKIDKIRFNRTEYKIFQEEGTGLSICLIPISYWLSPGTYTLELSGDGFIISKEIKVLAGNFQESFITVDSTQEEIVRPQNKETIKRKDRENQMIREARQESPAEKIWQGNFLWPVEGKISSPFGATRYVNGILNNRHSGIDIAAPRGTPVKAAADGIVKLAASLLSTGNTIIIDHGWYVTSSYSHLDSINVKVGDVVKKGDIIGTVGSTGVSTGPHLHWAVTVHGVFVNPEEFFYIEL